MAEEELYPPDARTGQRAGDLLGHVLRLLQMGRINIGGLEALAIIPVLLYMADGRTKQSRTVLLSHCKQGYLAIEADEFLDYQFLDIATTAATSVLPGVLQLVRSLHDGLAFAGGGHQRLHHAGKTNLGGGILQFVQRLGIVVACRLQSQFLGSQIADSLTVHGEVDRTCARHHLDALLLKFVKPLGANCFNFRHDEIGAMLAHGTLQSVSIQHTEHFTFVGHLHGGCSCIRVASDDVLPQTLGGNHELLA